MEDDAFERCLAIAWLPQNDGQEYHVTQGDPGGGTRFGVTFGLFRAWRLAHKQPAPSDFDFERCDISELREIIRAWIWTPCSCGVMPKGIDLMVFEAAFMSGPKEAVMCLQHCLGVDVDGIFGHHTLLALENQCSDRIDTLTMVHDIAEYYEDWLSELHNATLFLNGWKRRVDADVKIAEGWIKEAGIE